MEINTESSALGYAVFKSMHSESGEIFTHIEQEAF